MQKNSVSQCRDGDSRAAAGRNLPVLRCGSGPERNGGVKFGSFFRDFRVAHTPCWLRTFSSPRRVDVTPRVGIHHTGSHSDHPVLHRSAGGGIERCTGRAHLPFPGILRRNPHGGVYHRGGSSLFLPATCAR